MTDPADKLARGIGWKRRTGMSDLVPDKPRPETYKGPYGEFPIPQSKSQERRLAVQGRDHQASEIAERLCREFPAAFGLDPVNPSHYRRGGFELIDVLEAWDLHKDGRLMQAAQYLFRAPFKEDARQDVEKARWYLDRWLEKEGGSDGND